MKNLTFDNEMTLDELLDTNEFKNFTVDYEDAQYKKEYLENERIKFEYNQMVNDITTITEVCKSY